MLVQDIPAFSQGDTLLGFCFFPEAVSRTACRAPQNSIPSLVWGLFPASPALRLQMLLWKTAINLQVNKHLQSTSMFIY